MKNHDPKWWLVEPLWATAAAQGVLSATFFWPGSEVTKGSWNFPDKYCRHYNGSVPFEERVDTILGYFDLPPNQMP
jgi:ectonucleotide pyrophosphatase/phosphodiesterase family member 1/3